MSMRYFGEFYSRKGVLWRVEIWQNANSPFVPEEVRFPADSPLEIEWKYSDKLNPVIGSSATLVLESPSDRKFMDLYTIEVGTVLLNVKRQGELYWSGMLDPELYEEPFSRDKLYDVPLTFSDFSILERLNFSGKGFFSIRQLINSCLNACGFTIHHIREYISTSQYPGDSDKFLDETSVLADNFYDEGGKPVTLREMLEEVLRTFSLHIMQKHGEVIIYDLNALYSTLEPEVINWKSDDAVLGVDKVFNNVKVTFSPYSRHKLLKAELNEDDYPTPTEGGVLVYINNKDLKYTTDPIPEGFRVFLSTGTNDKITINAASGAKFYTISPIYSGSESRGVAHCMRPFNVQYLHAATPVFQNRNEKNNVISQELFRVNDMAYLGYIGYKRTNYKLKVSLDLLFDVRYNPFENADSLNESGNWTRLNAWCNFAYVPIILTLRDAQGKALYHYENKGVMLSNGYEGKGYWRAGEGAWGDAYLAYYDKSNRKSASGLGGWSTNLPSIGYYRGGLPSKLDKLGNGELIDLPTSAGWLELKVGTGVHQFDYERECKNIYDRTRWILYKNPSITLVDNYGNDLSSDDLEHSSWINKAAKEELTIDTIVGSMATPTPSARGQLFSSGTSSIINKFYRAGKQDYVERLLIGTVYSNYASRMNLLSGSVNLLPHFGILTDIHEPGRYILLNEVQNVIEDESEIKTVQFLPDNYEGIEYN